MASRFSAAYDARLEALLIRHALNRWRGLRLVPVALLRPLITPARRRLRRQIAIAALVSAPSGGLVTALVLCP